jgi:heat shock protein 1/8
VVFKFEASRGIPRIQVTFNVDANGILSITAREESTGKTKNIKIKNEKGRLSKAEIEKMVHDADKFKEEDEKCRMRINSRNLLESYLFSVRAALKEYGSKMADADFLKVDRLVSENILWLEGNREQSAEVYDEKCKHLQTYIMPIMERIHKKSDGVGGVKDKHGVVGPRIEEIY